MKAMLLAAGRGERMRPLTDATPKPLLRAGGRALIEYHLLKLGAAGFEDVVVNLSHLGAQIRAALGDGGRYGLRISYSAEGEPPLETAGGIVHALPLLGRGPFLVVNADLYTDYPFESLRHMPARKAHLVLVPNPDHHLRGDFALDGDLVRNEGGERHTFAGIAVYRPGFFRGLADGPAPLAPLLREAADREQVTGEVYEGCWLDVGTPQRLRELDRGLSGT